MTMRWEDLPPSWGGPAPGRVHPDLAALASSRLGARQAEYGDRALRALRYENEAFFLVEVPLPEVLLWRYQRGRLRAGLPTRVVGWLLDPSREVHSQVYVHVLGEPTAPDPLYDVGSLTFASWEIGQEWITVIEP